MASGQKKEKKSSRAATQASPKAAASGGNRSPVAWLITGFAMGLVVALIVHLEHTRPEPETIASPANNTEAATTDASAPRFEFYQLLSEQEVEVATREEAALEESSALPLATPESAPETATTPATEPAERQAQANSAVRYLLQAGSFRRSEDAESLRARLGLLGIEANLQRVELPGGETWHRVRIGPFSTLGTVNEVRARMASQNIESILLRAGG